MNDCIVLLKLINGETIIGNLVNETEDTAIVEKPIAIRTVQTNSSNGLIEKTVTAPFCTLTDDEEFSLDKRHVLHISNLHPAIIAMYYKVVTAFDDEYESMLSSIDDLTSGFNQYHEEEEDDELFLVTPDTKTVH